MSQVIRIDTVKPLQDVEFVDDTFQIEWFEVNKHLFNRATTKGVELSIEKEPSKQWSHGEVLFSKGVAIASIEIKKSLVICLPSVLKLDVADFCYYIGNRHLPIFVCSHSQQLLVPYDGNLYEQLVAKFSTKITLSEERLFMSDMIKKVNNQKYTVNEE